MSSNAAERIKNAKSMVDGPYNIRVCVEELEEYYEELEEALSDLEDEEPDEDSEDYEAWEEECSHIESIMEEVQERIEEES